MGKNGTGDDRSRCIAEFFGDTNINIVGGKDLERRKLGRPRKGMGIHPHKKSTADSRLFSIITDGLGHGKNMIFIKTAFQ